MKQFEYRKKRKYTNLADWMAALEPQPLFYPLPCFSVEKSAFARNSYKNVVCFNSLLFFNSFGVFFFVVVVGFSPFEFSFLLISKNSEKYI